MKKLFFLLSGLLTTQLSLAESPADHVKTFWSDPIADPLLPVYLIIFSIFLIIVLVAIVAIYMLRVLNLFVEEERKNTASRLGVVYRPAPSMWRRLWEKINASVPVEREESIELNHDFDGIKELDNHLPPWWKWLFYGTIAWSIVYLILFHVTSSLPLSIQEYDHEVVTAKENLEKLRASQPVISIDENALVFTRDAAIIENGKKIFVGNCASCHKENGAGGVGPNLTDNYWLHGGGIKNIYSTIKNGVPEKGMISWGPILKPDEIRDAAYYVMSLAGTNPPGAKAPQGELAKPENASSEPDSLKMQTSL